jgi:Ni/Co efflux regulator RcnB
MVTVTSMEKANMKKHLMAVLMAIAVTAPLSVPTVATAQQNRNRDRDRDQHQQDQRGQRDHRWQGDQNRNWEPSQHYQARSRGERRLSRRDHIYKGRDGRAYCRRNDGTTGLVVGALGGGVLANLVGGNTLETLLGAGGGALLGRSIDRGQVKCR